MKILLTLFTALTFSLGFAQFPVTITDTAGHELTLEAAPERFTCVWNGCVSDLAFIGVMPDIINEGLVDLGSHPAYFGEAFSELPTFPVREGLPDMEALLALEPDLVVGNDEVYTATSEFVPSYEQNYDSETLDLFFTDVRNYARMFGRGEETEARIARLLERAEAYGSASGREKSIYIGFPNDEEGSAWNISGGATSCGFVQPEGQCSAEFDDEWQEVSVEGLLSIDPDVFIVEDHGEQYGEETRAALENLSTNPLWGELSAVQNEQVHLLGRAVSRPGDPLVLELWLDTVMPLAYPDLFPEPLTDTQVQKILNQ